MICLRWARYERKEAGTPQLPKYRCRRLGSGRTIAVRPLPTMGVISETKASIMRFRAYGNQLGDILSKYQIHTPEDIRRQAEDPQLRAELGRLWADVLHAEGGKLTL